MYIPNLLVGIYLHAKPPMTLCLICRRNPLFVRWRLVSTVKPCPHRRPRIRVLYTSEKLLATVGRARLRLSDFRATRRRHKAHVHTSACVWVVANRTPAHVLIAVQIVYHAARARVIYERIARCKSNAHARFFLFVRYIVVLFAVKCVQLWHHMVVSRCDLSMRAKVF